MYIKWFTILFILHLVHGRKCPTECSCDQDEKGRFHISCTKGGMKEIPVTSFDLDVVKIFIKGPRNQLTIGPIFQPFTKLEVLTILDSNVPAIGKNSFWGVPSLRYLDLSKNNITQITDDNFRGQDSLLELNLSKNKMDRMPSSVFRHLGNLTYLNLADNSLEEIVQRLFHLLGKLRILDLSGNPLVELPPDMFKDIVGLHILKCRGCQLSRINQQLYYILRDLIELDLGGNKILYLEREEFENLKHLKKLHLDGNQISSIVDFTFSHQHSLQYLDLSRNRLAKIAESAFVNLSNLIYLDISYNKLMKIEVETIYPLTKLRILNISGSLQLDLMAIRDVFNQIKDIKTLSIADMGMLPLGLLVPLSQLKSLNLSGNHLDNNSMQILNPVSHLELLDLSRNLLDGIENDFVMLLKKVKDVRLENNPLICDRCHMGPLIAASRKLKWSQPPVCYQPESLRGLSIKDLDLDHLDNCLEFLDDEGHDAASTSHNFLEQGHLNILAFFAAIVFVLLAIIILASIACYTRQRARYYTNEEKRADAAAMEKPLDATITAKTTIETDKEINFKFPIQDRVCTIDDIRLPPPPPPPCKLIQKLNNNGYN